MGPSVIAYDLGTGGIKASLVTGAGSILYSEFLSYPTYYPQDDFQEQDPDDWWNGLITVTHALLKRPGVKKEAIIAVAISGHSLGTVPISHTGSLLSHRVPIWSDQRATAEQDDFFSRIDYLDWYMHTGNGFPAACYSVFKMMWYREHCPELFSSTRCFIGTKDYCNYRLTGKLCTDYSYASGSGVFNLEDWSYCKEYIRASGLDSSLFPDIIASDAIVGTLTPEACAQTGLPATVKVICGGVDNSCMALGARGIETGRVYTSLGSSAWIALISDEPVLDFARKPYVFAHVIKGMYASATCIFSAGTSFKWVANLLCSDLAEVEKHGGESIYAAIDRLISESPSGARGVLFNPSLAGGSMLEPSPSINGAFTGLRLSHTRADLLRATQEGIALNLKIALDLLLEYYPHVSDMLFVGGGAKSKGWLQLFADIYGLEVLKSNIDQEAASLGAAALALKGMGVWKDFSPIDDLHLHMEVFLPDSEKEQLYADKLSLFRELSRMLPEFSSINS